MPHKIKNLSGFPLDVATINGPAILPANGEIVVELGAYDADALATSPFIEISVVDPLDHDADGKKGGAKPAPVKPQLRKNIRG